MADFVVDSVDGTQVWAFFGGDRGGKLLALEIDVAGRGISATLDRRGALALARHIVEFYGLAPVEIEDLFT